MHELCVDIGYQSVNHDGEELCGDHVEVVEVGDTTVIVLADGLGSGVKACILSTLTSKIISTMVGAGLTVENCIETVAATLPVCSVRSMAYSTFTILVIDPQGMAEIYQFDNPEIIWFREGEDFPYPAQKVILGGKEMLKTRLKLQEDDLLIAMSDGCPRAGPGKVFNLAWTRFAISDFVLPYVLIGATAKTVATELLQKIYQLYEEKPFDDATVCVVRLRKRKQINLLFGPPANRDDCTRMMALFFGKSGKHIVCGGTTSTIASGFLGKPIVPIMEYHNSDIPAMAKIEGVDLVTEGILTINQVLAYARSYLAENEEYAHWGFAHDGASQISQLLFEYATDINFFVGKAINPAHQNPELPINFSIKMQLIGELAECLKKMGKKIKVSYF